MSQPFRDSLAYRLTVLLLAAAAPSLCGARYTAEQLRAGISLEELRAAISAAGESVVKGSTDEFLMIYRTVRSEHEITASYRLCSGRVYEESVAVSGGTAGFIRRVTQFEREFGPGRYSAESSLLEAGERNLLSVAWRLPDRVVTIEYGAPAAGISESQWISTAIPSVCTGAANNDRQGSSK
jgi:hypothetical protein